MCEGLFGLLLRLCNFLQYATAPLVAAAASKGESEAQQGVVAQAVWLALMLGVAVAIGILVAAEQALDWLGAARLGSGAVAPSISTCPSSHSSPLTLSCSAPPPFVL